MAGKKDYSIVTVITGLTSTQAANISRDIQKSKHKHAPSSRGTTATGSKEDVGSLLQRGIRLIGGK